MERLHMKSGDAVDGNVAKIGSLFPQCITERIGKNGQLEHAIDFEKLKAELSKEIVEEGEERYQFTWPDKRAASRLANTPTTMTLRPDVKSSVDFWNTQNLYIEGDNLDVLKILRENYLGKVKMIYIDPPYNTGNDFVYNDDYNNRDYYNKNVDWDGVYNEKENSIGMGIRRGAFDESGNQLLDAMQRNTESNGRFHTDWLNMIYPRLKVSRDLLSYDGVIFISIDDNEYDNLRKVCDEIFGQNNFIATFPWRKRTAKSDVPYGVSQDYEWIIAYCKSDAFVGSLEGKGRKYYTTPDFPNRPWRIHDMTTQRTALERPNSDFTIINPKNGEKYPVNPQAVWRITEEGYPLYLAQNRIVFPGDYSFLSISKPVLRYWEEDDRVKDGENFGRIAVSTKLEDSIGMSQDGTKEISSLFDRKVFSYPKPSTLLKFFCKICNDKSATILDFFSGSATTAHAVMKLNAEDVGHRKFIMVQVPEVTDEKSEAQKAGYETICQVGEERIRRAGRKIIDEIRTSEKPFINNDKNLFEEDSSLFNTPDSELPDVGFRVLKLDSSNMEDVYYSPEEFDASQIAGFVDNVKPDRTPLDLLFQVMPELDIELSAKIEEKEVNGKKVFFVDGTYLIATFDTEVNESTVTEIAKIKPQYFVMRDASAANDNVLDNFEQIFRHYSPETIRKIL